MAITSDRLRLAYFDMPKVANTSLKKTFWEIETGGYTKDFSQISQSSRLARRLLSVLSSSSKAPKDIHHTPGYLSESFIASKPIPDGYETVAVVRDPILRLYSAWNDKISARQHRNVGITQDILNEGLPEDPSFGEFIDNFDAYRFLARPARVHTYGYAFHLGPNISWFNHIFKIEEMLRLSEFLSQRVGHNVTIPRENRGPANMRDGSLTPKQVDRLLELTANDYQWLGDIYSPENALARLGLTPHPQDLGGQCLHEPAC